MKKHIKLLLLAILAIALCIATVGLCACIVTPDNPDNTDKSKLTVKYDDSHTVYEGDDLDSLKPYLTVTYTDKDGKVTTVTDYTLSGTLAKGESEIKISYNGTIYTVKLTVLENGQQRPITYTVTFKADGKAVSTQNYTKDNKQITVPDVPVKIGYTGIWEQYTLTTGDITVNAVYTAKQYTVTLNYNEATGGNTQRTLTVTYDQPIGALPTPTKTGYEFAGWKHGVNAVTSSTVWKTDGDATFTAQWNKQCDNPQPQEYTVAFKADGKIVSTQKYTADNKNITVPNVPSKIGYNGVWEQYTLTTGDLTVNAVYTAKQYTITLDYNGATAGNEQQTITVTYGQSIGTLPTPEKTGFDFVGWKNGETTVTSATVWKTDDNATFTAQWRKTTPTESLIYSINDDGSSYSVTGIRTTTETDIVIPSLYKDKPVTSIGSSAFNNSSYLTTVTIPDSITSIGSLAFQNGLHTVNINYLGTIESWCKIEGLKNLMSCCHGNITFSLNGIEATEIEIPETVTAIPSYAFFNCTNITNITIPKSVTRIDSFALCACRSLTNIIIPENVTSIGDRAFGSCSALTIYCEVKYKQSGWHRYWNYSDCHVVWDCKNNCKDENGYEYAIIDGIRYTLKDNKAIVIGQPANITEANIPQKVAYRETEYSVIAIEAKAFYFCESLSYAVVGNGITSISCNTFYHCSSLTNITISDSVTSIASEAFFSCDNLSNINYLGTIDSWCKIEGLDNLMRYDTSSKTLIINGKEVTGDLIIPSAVTSIPSGAFAKTSITSATIPDSLISIGKDAFYGCDNIASINYLGAIDSWCQIEGLENLMQYGTNNKVFSLNGIDVTELVIADTVTTIPYYTFAKINITSIVFTENSTCTNIGEYAFSDCSSLTSVTIDDSLISISGYVTLMPSIRISCAFNGCHNIAHINYLGTIDSWCKIKGLDNLLPYGLDDRKLIINGKEITGELVIPNTVTSISPYAFNHCSQITSVTFEENGQCTSIGDSAFYGCSSLESVTIPDSVTSIGSSAFSSCSSLTSITIPFVGASLNGTENTNFSYIFGNIPPSLKTVVITGGTTIDKNAFANCDNIINVTIPDSIKSIKSAAFSNCTNLINVIMLGCVPSISNLAFENCKKIRFNEFENALYLGNNTNKYLALIKVKSPDQTYCNINKNTKVIADNAFSGCDDLTSINFLGTIDDWCKIEGHSSLMRYGASSKTFSLNGVEATDIIISDTVTAIPSYAFFNCTNISSITIPDSVINIGYSVFTGCDSLQYNEYDNALYLGNTSNPYIVLIKAKDNSITSCTIHENTKIIYESAFANCDNLTSINYLGTIESWCNIQGLDNLMEYGTSSKTFSLNGVPVTDIVIPDTVTSIPSYAFAGTNITSVTIPDSVISIDYGTFYKCSSLTSITIPFIGANKDGTENTHFGYIFGNSSPNSFSNVPNSLKTVVITGGTSITEEAFLGCNSITSITIPSSIKRIDGDYYTGAFYNNRLKNINYLGTIDDWCKIEGLSNLMQYRNCIKTLIINGVEIAELVVPETVTTIQEDAFAKTNITSVTISNGVTNIASRSFLECSSLTSVTISASITTIGDYAFYGCSELTTIRFTGTVEQWNDITKGCDWNYKVPATKVICSDGEVEL